MENGAIIPKNILRPDPRQIFNQTVILAALFVETGHDVLRLLLEKGADCNVRDVTKGVTPLLYALTFASLRCIRLLLNHGAQISPVDQRRRHALHYAVQNPNTDVIQFILSMCLDIDQGDSRDYSALHAAVLYHNVTACEVLLRGGANVNRRGCARSSVTVVTPLGLAVRDPRVPLKLVQVLLDYGADLTDEYQCRRILTHAAAYSTREITKLLIWQIAKLTYQHRNIDADAVRKIIEDIDGYTEFYEECSQEIRDMKEARFYDNVSVFDIFMKSYKVISGYSRNEQLVQTLETRDYGKRFPNYFARLKKKFVAEVARQRLRQSAASTLCTVFNFNDPCHIINRTIVTYIEDEGLQFLV